MRGASTRSRPASTSRSWRSFASSSDRYYWIIVDTGAGPTDVILRQVLFADHALLVVNPVVTSIVDAYKLLKFLWLEKKQRPVDICLNMVATYEKPTPRTMFANPSKTYGATCRNPPPASRLIPSSTGSS